MLQARLAKIELAKRQKAKADLEQREVARKEKLKRELEGGDRNHLLMACSLACRSCDALRHLCGPRCSAVV